MRKALVLLFHKEENGRLFEKIILATKRRYRLVSLHELEHLIKQKQDLKNICHLSFDDGDISFYNVVFPLLKKHQVPVSLFISPDVITTNTNYWFQEVQDYDEKTVKQILSQQLNIPEGKLNHAPLKFIFKCLPIKKIENIIEIYQKQTQCRIKKPVNITLSQLKELAASDLVTIGAHTLKHPVLKNENDADSRQEITASIEKLEALTGKPVTYFAFPNGIPGLDFGEREMSYLRENNITLAFSAELDNLSAEHNLLSLPRMGFARMGLDPSNPLIFFRLNLGKRWIDIKSVGRLTEKVARERIMALLNHSMKAAGSSTSNQPIIYQ